MAKNLPKPSSAEEELAGTLIRDFERISQARSNWESHWQEIAERLLPGGEHVFNVDAVSTPGEKRTEKIFDSTAPEALEKFAAILDSLLTPRNQTWHQLKSTNAELNKMREVRRYFEEVNAILFAERYAPTANFASQNQQNFMSLGAFGTGCMFIDELDRRYGTGLRYRAMHLREIYFRENHQGLIDAADRCFKLSARQAVKMFGEKQLPEKILEALKKDPETEFKFLHCVNPREDVDYDRVDYKGMDFASYYLSFEGKKLLREGGYDSFPYAPSRYTQGFGEVYGRSPGMKALPAIKTLNAMKKAVLTAGHRATNPIYLMADDGILDTFSAKPGAMVAGGVSAEGRQLVHALQPGRVDIGKDLMDDERSVVNDAFLVNLFQIMVESPQMTATEVMERAREKGILMAPTMGRQQSEYLGAMVPREIDVLRTQRKLPPMPEVLKEAAGEYTIVYESPLSRQMRAEEASGIMRTVGYATEIFNATQDPSVMDHFEWDEIMPALAEIHGAPQKWMRGKDKIEQIRASRAEQGEAQQMIQAAPGAAAMVKAAAVANKGKA